MSAKFVQHNGNGSSQQYWIEDEVARVGSGADCALVVPGLPAHCLTLVYRAGAYSVINRCNRALDVAGVPLLPMATAPLAAGDCVTASPDLVLRLEIDGDPAPSRRPRPIGGPNAVNEPEVIAGTAPDRTLRLRRAFLVVAGVVAGGYLLLRGGGAGAHSDASTSREFHEIVEFLLSNPVDSGDGPARICRAVQRARVSELRGDMKRAIGYYEIAKDMLTEASEKPGCPARNIEPTIRVRAYNLIQRRLVTLK